MKRFVMAAIILICFAFNVSAENSVPIDVGDQMEQVDIQPVIHVNVFYHQVDKQVTQNRQDLSYTIYKNTSIVTAHTKIGTKESSDQPALPEDVGWKVNSTDSIYIEDTNRQQIVPPNRKSTEVIHKILEPPLCK